MLRARLLRLAEEEHILLLTMHHIAADGWSVRLLWRELRTLYDAYRRQAEPELPELPLQYVDFAVWQRNEWQRPAKRASAPLLADATRRAGGAGPAHRSPTSAATIVSGRQS